MQRIVAAAADEQIGFPQENSVGVITMQSIRAVAAVELVAAAEPDQDIVIGAAIERIGAVELRGHIGRIAHERVGADATGEPVRATRTDQQIVAFVTVQ